MDKIQLGARVDGEIAKVSDQSVGGDDKVLTYMLLDFLMCTLTR